MTKFLTFLLLVLRFRGEMMTQNISQSPLTSNLEQKREPIQIIYDRKLIDAEPYLTNHIIHHQPYYASGYAPYHIYSPMMLPPPSPMLALPPMVPPPPPLFTGGQLPVKNAYHVIHHPQHMSSPWNGNSFQSPFNSRPYGGNGFSQYGMGYPYGMSPYQNPYLSMMSMGSVYPFFGSMYGMGGFGGGYGMYGPNSPINNESSFNNIGSVDPLPQPSMGGGIPGMARKLLISTLENKNINDESKSRYLKDLEDSKQKLIESLQESLKQLQAS